MQSDPSDVFHDVDQLIHGHGFARAEIDRVNDLRARNQIDSLDAIVDEHEAARLISGAPDFDFVPAAALRLDDFAADRSGSLFTAAVPGSPGTVNVVEASDSRLESKVFAEMTAHSFGKQLLPSVAVFR